MYPHYELPFPFTRVKAFSGIIETCSQHMQEAGALSRNKPSNISQRRFYPVGPGGLFNTSLSLHLYSINVTEQHEIKWPLCCFTKGLEHIYKQLCVTQGHQQRPHTPPHRHLLLCPSLGLRSRLGTRPLPLPARQGPACTPRGSGSTAQGPRQPPSPEASAQPSSSAASFAPAAGLTSRVPFCPVHGFFWPSSAAIPSPSAGSAAGMQHLHLLTPSACGWG